MAAVKFHGHLGPWLVIGLIMGEFALSILKAKKYFGINVKAFGLNVKPRSCLIDGLQMSTGATYGKGNIKKINAKNIKVIFENTKEERKLVVTIKKELLKKLAALDTHADSEKFAKELSSLTAKELFDAKFSV
jgi:formylmethanofuran dehydrogenase subunit E